MNSFEEQFVDTKAFGRVPCLIRDEPLPRWTLWCEGLGVSGMLPELVSREVDCDNIHVMIAAIRVTARELNEWKPVDVFMYLEECYWSSTGQQLTFKFADQESWVELPILGNIMDVTDAEMAELAG